METDQGWKPDLILLKCVRHTLDLIAAKPMDTVLEYMVGDSLNYFAHSSIRLTAYKGLYNPMVEQSDSDKVELPQFLSTTRLVGMHRHSFHFSRGGRGP